ncbi:hypothetical protein V2J09_023861 [Rumex salicifolius]
MADSGDPVANNSPISFSDFPDDVQLCILSFLSPADLSSFSCTSKLFASLCRADSKLWYALCDRIWGSKTEIKKWGNGQVGFKHLYRTLAEYQKLIGFWRRVGDSGDNLIDDSNSIDSSALVFFEWGPSSITGSKVSPSKFGGYNVFKTPFIWISLSSDGGALSYLDPNSRVVSDNPDFSEKDLVPVNVNFVGRGHVFLLEESRESSGAGNTWQMSGNFPSSGGEELIGNEIENMVGGGELGSPPERLMSEMYQYFANRMSPGAGGDRAWRRQRRRERERRRRRRWEPQHLVKIVQSSPSPSRPLQGLWKGICEDMTLDFYLVTYDDMGGIVCRRVDDSLKAPSGGGPPVFWTSTATFIESPLSLEEDLLYSTCVHLSHVSSTATDDVPEILHPRYEEEVVSRIMYINSSYDLVIPDLAETAANPRHFQGQIWVYSDGTFGFGFLRNNFIIDLKHITKDDQLLHM